ncbi:hypothetical protein ASPWEDRAFT_55458 [Aspergillus wentii DTO 134E9]|uniref:Semialdehyde dehydrogenase NAD-binding domain-containing protein n=1 Tax=Aspergillus wentii DTO 134E9 TaxID=1073089 RepID=A0A1L9R4V3_ASPWE|nr:uncharacterized protein ASPWEDRAFT_55458 [Aspergillus wentii DTO 134E9]OJJ29951.1 hypothetical protein ASPWEDRAFT_55458 [Aspergillus wentii DTO 134E9]
MSRLFITGATGYIGGQVLHSVRHAHPNIEITALVRSESKAKTISDALPGVKITLGDLENDGLIEEQAAKADIIINAASSKHIQSVKAIARGIERRQKPVYWLQISGASVLSFPEIEAKVYGEPSDKIYGDVSNIQDIKELISKYSSARVVDNFILSLNKQNVKTALIFPPIIYGVGQGPVNQRSIQIPELARLGMQNGEVIQVGKGASRWSNVHIGDVGDLFARLTDKALAGDENEQLWNGNGIYFPENGLRPFGEISQLVANAAVKSGSIQNDQVKSVSHAEADGLMGHGGVLWGTNAALKGERARKYLDWKPQGETLEENIPKTVQLEKSKL